MERKIRNEKEKKRQARRTRTAISSARGGRVRLTIFRSARHIYAQLISQDGRTLASVSTRSKSEGSGEGGKLAAAKQVGQAIAEVAKEHQIAQVVFNRNGFLYHGRVKALAEGAREGGLEF